MKPSLTPSKTRHVGKAWHYLEAASTVDDPDGHGQARVHHLSPTGAGIPVGPKRVDYYRLDTRSPAKHSFISFERRAPHEQKTRLPYSSSYLQPRSDHNNGVVDTRLDNFSIGPRQPHHFIKHPRHTYRKLKKTVIVTPGCNNRSITLQSNEVN